MLWINKDLQNILQVTKVITLFISMQSNLTNGIEECYTMPRNIRKINKTEEREI